MSELEYDWIQRDLDGGASGLDGGVRLDLVSELRYGRFAAELTDVEDLFEDDDLFDDDLDDRR